MSVHHSSVSRPFLMRLGDRFLRSGARSAVMTPFSSAKHTRTDDHNERITWDLVRHEHRLRAGGARILHLFGEVLCFDGTPVPDAIVEIRQCDMHGRAPSEQSQASDFHGVGRVVTDFEGRYQFRTILPVPDKAGSAYIDAVIAPPTRKKLATRLYLLNNRANELDWNYLSLGPARQAAVSLDPIERADGDLDAGFNFVL